MGYGTGVSAELADSERRRLSGDATDPGYPSDLIDVKLRRPILRPGIVERKALVDRLVCSREPVVTIIAPPGYGKTTLLAQWAERRSDPVAWVSCDDADNDPAVLLSALIRAMDRIRPVDPALLSGLAASGGSITFVTRVVSAVAGTAAAVTLMLDHTEAITNPRCRAVIAELVVRLPTGWQLVLASRDTPPVPTARLRVQGEILEIGVDDLAMAQPEAAQLVAGAGIDIEDNDVHTLVSMTEGWPAGLYLAALAGRSGRARRSTPPQFAGDDRFIQDYLHTELLSRLSDAELEFLTRTSVLDRMCGSLCDAIVGTNRSALRLQELEDRNLLVVPLDHRREWFRYHHLLRELLQAELRRREPQLLPSLHRRAAAWYESNGSAELAIEHAQQAGDYDKAARLVLAVQQTVWAGGRVESVRRWMEGLRDRTLVPHYGAIAAHGALIFALLGRAGEAERWTAAAERVSDTGMLPDGSTMAATMAYLRAIVFRSGVSEMRRDARLAYEGLSPSSPYRATMLHTEGLSYLLDGDASAADAVFARAYDAAIDSNAMPLAALVLAERCNVAVETDDWPTAVTLSQRAIDIVVDGGFEDYWTSALVYAWAARAALHRGDPTAARRYLAAAARLRPMLTYALPAISTQTLLEMAHAYLALADPGGAAAVLLQARDIIKQRPDLGSLPDVAAALQARLAEARSNTIGSSSLTAAELRLLPFLATHLSFREIAEQLSLSFHTVKSQAYSTYQKLGISSRSEAVRRTRELGLADV